MPLDPAAEAVLRAALVREQVPKELQDALLGAVVDMFGHYQSGKLRPAELSGGDFVEATFRILQYLSVGTYARLGDPLPRVDDLVRTLQQSGLDESIRFHIPRLLQAMYGVRNRRGVGHLPGPVSANFPDAELLLTAAKWVLTEFIRLFHTVSHSDAQAIIDSLAQREIPLVQDFEGTRRVLSRSRLSLPEQVLVLGYAAQPQQLTERQLIDSTRADPKRLVEAVKRLDGRDLLHRFSDGRVTLTRGGERQAESVLSQLNRQNAPVKGRPRRRATVRGSRRRG